MSKRKATDVVAYPMNKPNTSSNYVFYMAVQRNKKIQNISATKTGKRPIYRFFINYDNCFFPLRCRLELGSTPFVKSPEAAKAFTIPVIRTTEKVKSEDVTGTEIVTEGLFTARLGLPLGNHHPYDKEDHAFDVIKTSTV